MLAMYILSVRVLMITTISCLLNSVVAVQSNICSASGTLPLRETLQQY